MILAAHHLRAAEGAGRVFTATRPAYPNPARPERSRAAGAFSSDAPANPFERPQWSIRPRSSNVSASVSRKAGRLCAYVYDLAAAMGDADQASEDIAQVQHYIAVQQRAARGW